MEFEKVKGEQVVPARYLRSQHQKPAELASIAVCDTEGAVSFAATDAGATPCHHQQLLQSFLEVKVSLVD
jgi:hypothetical protein